MDMFKNIFFLVLVTVSNGFPMDMLLRSVAESDSFDDSDNYIPKYDDLPIYNHPFNFFMNDSFVQDDNTENKTEINTPFEIGVLTSANLFPNKNMDNISTNIGDSVYNLFADNVDETMSKPPVKETNTTSTDNEEKPKAIKLLNINDDKGNIDKTIKYTSKDKENFERTSTLRSIILLTLNNRTVITSKTADNVNNTDEKEDNVEIIQKSAVSTKEPHVFEINSTFDINDVDSSLNESTRNPRRKEKESQVDGSSSEEDGDQGNGVSSQNGKSSEEDKASQESEEGGEGSEEEEEEDMNMVTGLLSALLGGLSKPDGSIDLEAIVGLIGSLSTQNDDGTYDFQGLTDLLKGFFGGGDGGGGSDIGAFTGGLLGAVIKGIANPPGGKGVGILTAKILAGILPALSVQPPDPDMMGDGKPTKVKPGGIDIGGFLGGFIKTLFGASRDINPVKFLISTITSLSNSKPKQPKGH